MNAFADAIHKVPTALTKNGAATHVSTASALVDLFFVIGSANLKTTPITQLVAMFENAFAVDEDRATRLLLWTRDVREGAGRREVFRRMLVELTKTREALVARILTRVAELGRWDDLLIFEAGSATEAVAFGLIRDAIRAKNGLCAKWMPRQGAQAERLRDALGFKGHGSYRRTLASLSSTVEQQMSARKWGGINYSHVPSVASVRYAKAFSKHDKERYSQWRDDLKTARTAPETLEPEKRAVKVNVGAVYPHDLIIALRNGDSITANEQWERLPDFVGDNSVMAVVDVSGSMQSRIQGNVTPLDISLALGLYTASKNTGPFSDLFMTFTNNPRFVSIRGQETLEAKLRAALSGEVGYNTNVQASVALLLSHAQATRAAPTDMPSTLLFISDMEFDSAAGGTTNFKGFEDQYAAAGYPMPQVVFWNVNARPGNNPVKFDQRGVALVSGFSPTILKAVLAGTGLSPIEMLDAVIMKDRYDLNAVAA